MLLSLEDLGRTRTQRILLVLCGLLIYALLCYGLASQGYLDVATGTFNVLLGAWLLGFLVLLFADENGERFDAGALTFTKALWCNVGVVIMAALVPHVIRLLLLLVPLFGVLYAALHLERREMLTIAGLTLAVYLLSACLLVLVNSADPAFEALLAAAFLCMLGAMTVLASEVTALRSAFARRRQRLNEVMEQLAEFAMRDDLTGLYNRRYIMEVLARQKALADRGHLPFSVCYCDLDHFKRVNDQFGHAAGDGVLRSFAGIASDVVRSVDYVARLGGEEFLLVLVGTDEERALSVARRLCERTRQELTVPRLQTRDQPAALAGELTVSVGVAGFVPGERVEDVIQRADQALYRAKSEGRDRIVHADTA